MKKLARTKALDLSISITLMFSLMFSQINVVYSIKHNVVNTYEYASGFKNIPFLLGNTTVFDNGTIMGLYKAEFEFHNGETIVKVRYIDYKLEGFRNEDVVEKIRGDLGRTQVHVVKHASPPYKCFLGVNSTWVTPYHYPPGLLLEHNVDSKGVFRFECLDPEGVAFEKHYYKHDMDTGILIELNVSINFYLKEYNLTGQRWFTIKLVDSNTLSLVISQKLGAIDERLIFITALAPAVASVTLSKFKRRG